MFARVKTVRANGRSYDYVHIVENRREGGRVRQRILGSLGRLDALLAKGDLERVIAGLVAHCPKVKLVQAQKEDRLAAEGDRVWGPVLVFERLWEELGLADLFHELGRHRRLGFDVERGAFALVLQRLLAPGSDLAGSKWIDTVEARGFEKLRLQHFYKTVGLLWRWEEKIETHLHERGRDLFNDGLDVVFFDTTSTYFEGVVWDGWARRGKSRDYRPQNLQLVLGVVMRRDGIPVTCEIWPGNTTDARTVVPILDSLRKRFRIRDVVFVSDRGMVSAANLKALDKAGYPYIVGMKMRGLLDVREKVLGRAGRYRVVDTNLHVKEVQVGDRRYVICFNPERAEKDRKDREAILERLKEKLARGGVKTLIPHRGFRRYLKAQRGAFTIDEKKVREDERYDGRYVLRTTTFLPAVEVAEAYKQLFWVERLWRELKSVVEVRPIYHHKKKENVKGHIFGSFLALYLSAMLRRRLHEQAAKDHPEWYLPPDGSEPARLHAPWDELMRDLSQVRAVRVRLENQPYLLRTEMKGHADFAFRAVGVRPPSAAQAI
ncbi:MAG: IS1634 family transposase [Planctomycetes bacterium]|nr:IS1634 family transposase [Planctomycetota bacterium]